MFTPCEDENRRLLRARDAIDRHYAEPLDVPTLARIAVMSPAHFSRRFRTVFGETPHRYLQRRRIERACALLREGSLSVTDVGLAVGYDSLGTFSRTFASIIGRSPSVYRSAWSGVAGVTSAQVPACFVRAWTRPAALSSFGEASAPTSSVVSPP
ncbi:helix-turn-helix domain-containing protein [Gordonia aquimaris]|uniref:AraC family transcriptional regulator n=1 Tax=Gordonia aquimaris TaxID=2984863 RepID=A0A9X3D7V9_9ACTN|nr:AraC family transcriptional regulator [Gordonia aquimaris]MCX2965311.1 AraC family transcriptional regulator [Gordonia aquimaris]